MHVVLQTTTSTTVLLLHNSLTLDLDYRVAS